MGENIVPHSYRITRKDRMEANGHDSFLVLFTGLSGSGKSTLANAVEQVLFNRGISTYVLDGDNVRTGINKNLSFSPEDRSENIRRIGELCRLFVDAGLVVLAAFVAPYRVDRELIRDLVGAENYVEVYVNTSLETCENRDVKGLYARARKGEIENMTGIGDPYEVPVNPDIVVTAEQTIKESVKRILKLIDTKIRRKS